MSSPQKDLDRFIEAVSLRQCDVKVVMYVEGPSDVAALGTLLSRWKERLREQSVRLHLVHLDNKSNFLRKIGPRAAQQLMDDCEALIVGLPDLYPKIEEGDARFRHGSASELKAVQERLVEEALRRMGVGPAARTTTLERFKAAVFRHDMEVVLLAAKDPLRSHLRTSDKLNAIPVRVEDLNHHRPPKLIVGELFEKYLRRKYRDTTDAPAVLRAVTSIESITRHNGQDRCPELAATFAWLSEKTGVQVC